MQRRLAAPLLLLFCTALTIVLLPYPASARVLGLFPSGSPSFSISHLGGPNAGSELPGTEWVTTTAGSGLDLSKIERMRQGNPKMGTSLNLLYDAYRDGGRSGAQQFAYQHLMVADGRRVQVEVTADVDAMAAIREAIEALGGEYQGHHKTLLQAMVPFEALGALAGQPQVWFVRQPLRAMPEEPSAVGAETSEGVDASNASAWHAAGYDGSGVKVAVVDSGFEGYAALLGTELPASVQTRDYTGEGMGGSEHGAGCAEIVHDMAPGADMYLYKVSTMVELSRAVDDLIAENVEIISMSLGWPIDGPGDGTGYLADIVNRARTNGIVFVKSAGNEAERSWSGRYQDSGNNTHRWSQQADVNAFGPEPGRCYHVDEGDQIRFALHWDDWTYVNQDYDLYLVRWTGSGWEVVQASTAYQDGRPGQEPTEMINILAPSEACYGAVVHRASATRDVCLRLSAKDSDGNPLVYTVPSRSLSFPGDSPDAFTVGAVDVISPPAYPLEPYSSQGPTFGPGGACTGGALKPDIAAYARVSTDSYGPTGFAGTSAACPHVAGSSALVKQANPLYTVSDLQNFLEGRAIDQGPAGKDSMYGAGRLHLGPPPEAGTPTPTRTATPTRTGTPT
ncbi:MAG: S8 family serine peptidase, partial [Anaerolineales bacterium]